MTDGRVPDPGAAGAGALGRSWSLVFAVLAYCWAAVGWHRYVLLEETGNGIVPAMALGRVISYLGRAFVVGLVVILAVIGGGLVVALAVGSRSRGGSRCFSGSVSSSARPGSRPGSALCCRRPRSASA
jgi:hypothetical protein